MPASLLDLSVYTSLEISRALAQDARYKFQPILTKFFSKFYQSPTDSIAYEFQSTPDLINRENLYATEQCTLNGVSIHSRFN